MTEKRALITGITGQDGSYLAELLLEKGYEVHGMVRRSSTEKFERIEHLRNRITLHQGDLLDQRSLVDALRVSRPDEIYNLAAMSSTCVNVRVWRPDPKIWSGRCPSSTFLIRSGTACARPGSSSGISPGP